MRGLKKNEERDKEEILNIMRGTLKETKMNKRTKDGKIRRGTNKNDDPIRAKNTQKQDRVIYFRSKLLTKINHRNNITEGF